MKVIRELKANEINGIKEDRTLSLYQDGRLNELLRGFRNAVYKHNTSIVIIPDGKSGLGKTTISFQTAITLDKNFGLHKVHFSPKTFLEGSETKIGLANAKKGDCIVFDEAMIVSNRSTMSRINKMIVQAMSMIRSKNIFVIFNVNSIFDLDRNLSIFRADLLLHIYGNNIIDRGRFCAFFKGRDGIDRLKMLYLYGRKMYDYSKPKANFIGKFTKEFVIDEKLYETEKQKGINDFLQGKEKKTFEKHKAVIELRKKGLKMSEIAKIVSLTRQQVWNILKEYDDKTQKS